MRAAQKSKSQKFRVLIVDDEAGMRCLVHRILARHFDVEIAEAYDGLGAVEHVASQRTDLVLLDLEMPLMDGFETLEAIRRARTRDELPVIMLSGNSDETNVRRILALQANDFVTKPFTPALLAQRCEKFLKGADVLTRTRRTPAPVELDPGSRVLIVDGSAEHRQSLAERLRGACHVDDTDSPTVALRQCVSLPPAALFLGRAHKIMDDAWLLQKYLEMPELHRIKLIRVCEQDTAAREDAGAAWTMVRTLDPGGILEGLRNCLADAPFARVLVAPSSGFLAQILDRCSTVIAAALGEAPVASTLPAAEAAAAAATNQRHIAATVPVRIGPLDCALELELSHEAAVQVVTRRLGIQADCVSDEQIADSLTNASRSLAECLVPAVEAYRLQAALAAPRLRWLTAPRAQAGPPGERRSSRSLRTRNPRVLVELSLRVESRDAR